MPYLRKQAISAYLRSECERRLRLDLTPDTQTYAAERLAEKMPPRAVVRPGLTALVQAGDEWEAAKLSDLAQTFGAGHLVGKAKKVGSVLQFAAEDLATLIGSATPGQFLVQAEFDVGAAFEAALNIASYRTTFALGYARLRPDLIQIFSAMTFDRYVRPDGALVRLAANDERVQLRIIDIKLTAEPSIAYYAEVTYYAMALAGWLVDRGLDARFVVVPEAAVWPGSHDASTLVRLVRERQGQGTTATTLELLQALDDDLEKVIFDVFAPRLRRFFQEDLQRVFSQSWRTLEWHVDNRCIGCDYLGFPWPGATTHQDHCYPTAQQGDHLSRVAFVTRGARTALEDSQISTVAALASTQPADSAYDSHQVLRATRTVVSGRAQSLTTGVPAIPAQAGTSAVMPRWADLKVYLSADFDVGSGISICFGLKAFWWVQPQHVAAGTPNQRVWRPETFPIEDRDVAVEKRELLRFLKRIHEVLEAASQAYPKSTMQVYIWDSVTYDHLVRVMGRHLNTILQDSDLRYLAWLFPPDSIVANPELSTRRSPITVVRDVVRAVLAAPVPHYYSLLSVARIYHSAATLPPWDQFTVVSLFEDPLSDQVPSERAHEIWSRSSSRPWNQQLAQLERTVKTKLDALESVTRRLGEDLGSLLGQTAPKIADIGGPSLSATMSADGRLWFSFAKLNEALTGLDVHQARAMPPHEREARFRSARLLSRLSGVAEAQALAKHNLAQRTGRFVYELALLSREVKAKDGDFSFALAPASRPGLLDDTLSHIAGTMTVPTPAWASPYERMDRVCGVTVRALDRDALQIVVDLNDDWAPTVIALEKAGVLDLSQDVMLDERHQDFLMKKLKATLEAIGNPPTAAAQPTVNQVVGAQRRPRVSQHTPPADVLWDGAKLYAAPVARNLLPVRALLAASGLDLNPSQWSAWERALTHRLRLIWGPPGTGKSRTLRAILTGALVEAHQQGRGLRVLLTGPTYEAIDNVLLDVNARIATGPLSVPGAEVWRLRSSTRPREANIPLSIDLELEGRRAPPPVAALQQRLAGSSGIILVGSTPHQVHNLLIAGNGAPLRPWFDLILIDEASQMDVASATLALAGIASNGAVVVAGDPQQLPPIHQTQAPVGLEHMVGPIYSYLQKRHVLAPEVLDENYRSNESIVHFAHEAGYPAALHAYSPQLELDLVGTLPTAAAAPAGWPTALHWTPAWAEMLNPGEPTVCFVYREGRSSQWNAFEADAVAALVWLLRSSLASQLKNEIDRTTGKPRALTGQRYTASSFWKEGVGVVTPHRAQQALVVARLQQVFAGQGATEPEIRSAVDTVERFQGQQRDVVIATFALGDPDAIRDEDEFLMSLNRFNVMASRARAKLVVLVSQEVVNHLPHDPEVLRQSALLKAYTETYCARARPMSLGNVVAGKPHVVGGTFRWR